ncbi:MAG: ribose-phosphate diphosphokinase [Rhodospirillaceae bacterium]|nr:ribose-phosphate diphosphokinase [Rhodospirillaceae bacterium]
MATRLPRKPRPPRVFPKVIYGFEHDTWLAADLARELNAEYRTILVHTFPDGESKVTVPKGAHSAAVCCSLDQPNRRLIEVFLAASALRDQGVRTLELVAPYLPYMRQDKAFHPGEAVSQKVIGGLLSQTFDRFIAVDPHLHRVKTLRRVFNGKPALALTAARAMASHFRDRSPDSDAVALGPDIESTPLVRAFAKAAGIQWAVASKKRRGDHDVDISLPDGVVFDRRSVVIVDDIVSSGTTIKTLARALKSAGAREVEVYVTHAVFDEKASRAFKRAGIERVFSCDGVHHASNAVSLAPLLAEGLMKCL